MDEDLPHVPVSPTATEEHKVMTAFINGDIDLITYLDLMDEIYDKKIENRRLTGRYE